MNPLNKTGIPLKRPPSDREVKLISLLADGYSQPYVAKQLNIQLRTVKWYIGRLCWRYDLLMDDTPARNLGNMHAVMWLVSWAFRNGVIK